MHICTHSLTLGSITGVFPIVCLVTYILTFESYGRFFICCTCYNNLSLKKGSLGKRNLHVICFVEMVFLLNSISNQIWPIMYITTLLRIMAIQIPVGPKSVYLPKAYSIGILKARSLVTLITNELPVSPSPFNRSFDLYVAMAIHSCFWQQYNYSHALI